MATASKPSERYNGYPTTDGKPMAETDDHRILMLDLIWALQAYFADDPMVYVSGNLLLFYEPGNKRRHLAPDVFVVKGVSNHRRPNYLMWEERPPNVVFELTSSSTRHVDTKRKFELYRDRLKVGEYFLFDPFEDYLKPSMQGYRLVKGVYEPIRPVKGRLPSKALGLHLERAGKELRLYDPTTRTFLPTPKEQVRDAQQEAITAAERAKEIEQRAIAETERAKEVEQRAIAETERAREAEQRAREAEQRAIADAARAREAEQRAAAETDRLRAELDRLRRQIGK
jgi:Uma2 family endonuclease